MNKNGGISSHIKMPNDEHSLCDAEHEQQINNSATILEKIAGLYAERLLSDICLEVEDKKYPAHRLILCASSDVFQVMLMNPNWRESQKRHIRLQEDPTCVPVFPDFLKYLYTGQLHINHFLVLPLVRLADKYNVKDLISLCINYMCRHVVSATKYGLLVAWLQYTLDCGHTSVFTACQNFITWNFENVANMDDFGSMETDVLINFLMKSDLVIEDESALFHCVAKWLDIQEEKIRVSVTANSDQSSTISETVEQVFEALVIEVMSHVRFPMMTPRQLANLLIHPLTARFKDFLVDCMSFAMSFHCTGILDPLQSALFTPRLYTAETWSATLSVENYPHLPTYGVRTLVFTTLASLADKDADHSYEWTVDIYPKGVWFKKFYLIVWQGTLEMPEFVSKTVRLSLTSKDPKETARVSVGVLVSGKQDGIEHVRTVIRKNFVFSDEDRMMNINELVSYDELNDLKQERSSFLLGKNSDVLKLVIVITPRN